MKKYQPPVHCRLRLLAILVLWPACLAAQDGLKVADLFSKYANQQDVTYVELNGKILKPYHMDAYKSLTFKDVMPYRQEIQQCLAQDKQENVQKTQEVTEGGILRSAFYQLSPVRRGRTTQNRYILFKIGKEETGTLIYIEGSLSEQDLLDMLYQSAKR